MATDIGPGDWVLFRVSRSYDPIAVEMKQATKVTANQVKFGTTYPRQCSRSEVLASFADQQEAAQVRDAIGGVAGEFNRRRREADSERSRRVHAALDAANKQVAEILARPTPAKERVG